MSKEFSCIECDYSTKYIGNYNKHCRTQKHIDKCDTGDIVELITPNTPNTFAPNTKSIPPKTSEYQNEHQKCIENTFVCSDCGNTYTRMYSLKRHKPRCKYKKYSKKSKKRISEGFGGGISEGNIQNFGGEKSNEVVHKKQFPSENLRKPSIFGGGAKKCGANITQFNLNSNDLSKTADSTSSVSVAIRGDSTAEEVLSTRDISNRFMTGFRFTNGYAVPIGASDTSKNDVSIDKGDNSIKRCMYCQKAISRMDNLRRHYDRCKIKKQLEFTANANNSAMAKELSHCKEELEYYKRLLDMAGGMANKAVSSLNHIVKNYENAPPIEKITLEEVRKLKNTGDDDEDVYNIKLIDAVFFAYNHGNIGKYIGDIIIALYKKEDPNEQSIWNTDSSRLTYLIKKLSDNDTSRWVVDKKGVETVDYVITPIIEKIREMSVVYRDSHCPDPESSDYDYDNVDHDKIMRLNTTFAELMMDIDTKKVHKDILKYMSSYFFFNK